MSGRSAYVRKKITETKGDGKGTRARAKSAASSDHGDMMIPDFPLPQGSMPVGTGVGTTTARFLKFPEPARDIDPMLNYRTTSTPSIGSQSGGSTDGRRDGMVAGHYQAAPLEDFAYARVRKPTIKTEDVSGIEKSGLRSMLDKKSGDVRKGLAKTFAFRRKDMDDRRGSSSTEGRYADFRPQSAATVRPQVSPAEPDYGYDGGNFNLDTMQMRHQNQEMEPWEGVPAAIMPPPSGKLPPVPQAAATPPIKRWIGAGRPVQRWNKLRKDPELWDPNGDVLVFFGHKGQSPRPNPSFRLSSHIIEATESRYLITLLREGSTEEDIHMPPSPAGAPPMLRHDLRVGSHMHLGHGLGRGGQPTPPISEDASLGEADGQISYEMYFPTPSNLAKVDQLRHHITTRNVFALLYHASLVGISLYQALTDLHTRLDKYLPADSDNVGMILNYLSARGIDDVRNDAETAVSLLAWSEGPEVRWEEGWRESFLHAAGMYSNLERCADFKSITPITRALLERASLETQLRVQAAEERLVEFLYDDMWPAGGLAANGPARAAADRLQKFLLGHYTRVFGYWPPLTPAQQAGNPPVSPGGSDGTESEEMWLTRTVAQSLQKDFGALYDYLVNRDVVWDMSEARSGRKWMMVSETGNKAFDADCPDLPMTDMLIEFDNKLRFPHIPHPYPLVPESISPAVVAPNSGKESSSMFKSSSKKAAVGNPNNSSSAGGNSGKAGALERRVQLAYSEATNIYILGSDFTQSDLIDAFVKYEKADRISEVDPAVARRGRWVLIYGILQTLASVSVDAPNVRYRDEVPYHMSPRLKGTKIPPWKGASNVDPTTDEAAHELSHCWVVQQTWGGSGPNTSSGGESSGGSGNTSPVMSGFVGMGRALGHPRGPPTTVTTTSRSSAMSYHTPTTRSFRSSGSVPAFSTAPSLVSESDTASSVRTPASSRHGAGMRRVHSRENMKGLGGGYGSFRSGNTFGGIERVDEVDYPIRRRDFSSSQSEYSSTYGGYARSNASSSHAAPLPLPGSITGTGGFLVLDDMVESTTGSFSTAVSGRGGGGNQRPLLGRDGSESSNASPKIRDFDLDVIDDAEP